MALLREVEDAQTVKSQAASEIGVDLRYRLMLVFRRGAAGERKHPHPLIVRTVVPLDVNHTLQDVRVGRSTIEIKEADKTTHANSP